MTCKLSISATGVLTSGATFVDVSGNPHPAATIRYIPQRGSMQRVDPSFSTFSAYSVARSVRTVKNRATKQLSGQDEIKKYDAGAHVAMCYGTSGSFFSVLVVRCDTWAVQWAVGRFPSDHQLKQVLLVSAHLAFGLATDSSGRTKMFVASRFDTVFAKKRENKLWKQFVASPRFIDPSFESEAVVVSPSSANSVIVLTQSGSLYLVTVDLTAIAEGTSASPVAEKLLLSSVVKSVSPRMNMTFVSSNDKGVLAVHTENQNCAQVFAAVGPLHEEASWTNAGKITVPDKHTISNIEWHEHWEFCVLFDGPKPGFQLFRVENSKQDHKLAIEKGEVVYTRFRPVLSFSSGKKLTLICTQEKDSVGVRMESLIHTIVSADDMPRVGSVIANAVWKPLPSALKPLGPRSAAEKNEASELFRDLQMLGERSGEDAGDDFWVPLELFYCLTAPQNLPNAESEVAVFGVRTAPFLHTRLIKQWHNAVNGLTQLLRTCSPTSQSLCLPWNPRHLRRALRLLDQTQLSTAFSNAADAVRRFSYAEVATSAVTVALQIVTLSRQLGASLIPDGVETIAVLLRASRAMGHESLRYGTRMTLLLDSTLQQRRMNSLLRRQEGRSVIVNEDNEENDKGDFSAIQHQFFGLPGELQSTRAIHTRYAINTWAHPLCEHIAHHKGVAEVANAYLFEAAAWLSLSTDPSTGAAVPATVESWQESGRRYQGSMVLENFESTLLTTEH